MFIFHRLHLEHHFSKLIPNIFYTGKLASTSFALKKTNKACSITCLPCATQLKKKCSYAFTLTEVCNSLSHAMHKEHFQIITKAQTCVFEFITYYNQCRQCYSNCLFAALKYIYISRCMVGLKK